MESSDDETDNDIPQSVWNIIPKYAAYIKNILKFSGYTTRESFTPLARGKSVTINFSFCAA